MEAHRETTGGQRDPLADLVLDEHLVRAAATTEPSAQQRTRPRAAAWSTPYTGPPRTPARTRISPARAAACAVAVLVAAWASVSGPGAGTGSSGSAALLGLGSLDAPTPRQAPSSSPLRPPPAAPAAGGPHAFVSTQPDGSPVSYDPCRPVAVVVNERTSVPDGDRMLAQALAVISEATGLVFSIEGPTVEEPVDGRRAFQPERYGDRWAPVLVAWSDPEQSPGLAGPIAGLAGSSWVQDRVPGTTVYVSGTVVLDGPQLAEMLHDEGWYAARSVVLHELGHLVGLAHVDDPRQLMHSAGHPGVVDPQPGDLAGLARLGRGACLEQL